MSGNPRIIPNGGFAPSAPPWGQSASSSYSAAYNDFEPQGGMPRQSGSNPANAFNDVFYGAGSGFIKSGLGVYGNKILGSGREYVQSNMSRYLSGHDLQYYFQVNDQYVKNKVKVVLFPFLHKGHWTRIAEQVAGGLTYKPPRYDINAPDLYIPIMAFATYIILCGIAQGLLGKFTSDVMGAKFTKALVGWAAEVVLLRCSLYALGSGDAPILDVVAYSGYAFVGVSFAILFRILSSYWIVPWVVGLWTGLCMAIFLVKTMKRILFAEVRSYDRDSSRHHYLLLFMGVVQLPLFFWLGSL
ncbi:protein transport protein YIF1 [Marchantia polymorpha subsp. ruderalis]|uniref:Uncharacterized protein n=2 Tax=Marchantia polymorpha TaxID=3197 RepID=A0AAF6BKF0_MARPO|nr:hypothetical protein MARPO_0058s0027 [Marchantia polymorpha]BBN12484.1 hypothetical protein Mp_5g20490 [Marchantia polymorpha subsp. ruderalis]|eukprot:PTQ37237.1 hypothetical protein MARPO_0058s0027 [Marchantia polymorpha]